MARFEFIGAILYLFFHSLTFLNGADILFPNQTISTAQTLISQNQVFELGFFSPGSSQNKFLGIWYKKTPDVVVWVANRNNPITYSQKLLLSLTINGTLNIISETTIIWSSNSSLLLGSNPVLHLLDTGNLVIKDINNVTNQSSFIWHSFDYPGDTRLPGMKLTINPDSGLTSWKTANDPSVGDFSYKIENQGLPEMVVSHGKGKRWRSGTWNGLYLSGGPWFLDPIFRPEMIFDGYKLISVSDTYNASLLQRLKLDESGFLQRYTMSEKNNNWNLVYTKPRDPCDNYAHCGPYGICRIERAPICECLSGFEPKFRQDWDLQDWSGGCDRIRPLNCLNGDGFLEVKGVKFPDMLEFLVNMSMSLYECEAECLSNCSCTAYANAYITNGGSGCLMWFGSLVDTRELPGADSRQNLYIRLPVSELELRTDLKEKNNKRRPRKLILILTGCGVLVIVLISCGMVIRRRLGRKERKDEDLELPLFKLATIVAATNNFTAENVIGEGGFGPVYRGNLSGEEEIAVKRLSRTSGQGLEEFKNEVILIAKLQHRNLVRLLGCCIEGEERMLIYEYLENKSLDYFVYDGNRTTMLMWPKRFDIIMGIARGLLYLHHDSRLKVIHRDLKTSNILLDTDLNPKISDFGLARIFGSDQTIARTKRVVGTYGYMAPEYAVDGKFSVKSDVFSFGVVLLEIVSGKKNRDFDHSEHYHNLLGHAWLLWKENRVLDLVDERLNDSFVESQVKRCIQVALLCVQKFAENRPVMSSVIFMLGTDGAILPEPMEPGFFVERSSSANRGRRMSTSKDSEQTTITITDLEPR
ncbi:hypothetical protein ACJIZ3_012670 [Penstemon smallii]|uniref:Receptor-like serine/threonine-protein kinase n=1 Tax=Penstemon smallii TaxID=265156 RepID=A0ABD3URW9_9LAMI